MKVLFSNGLPFFLAHGGTQTLLESIMRELGNLGVEVEPERWWDENQKGDIIHFMNRPAILNVRAAKQKGFKVIMTENLDQTASRTAGQLFTQRCFTKVARAILPAGLLARLGWDAYQELDAMVYVVEHEAKVAAYLFNADQTKMHVIPHGADEKALEELANPQPEEDYLICTATIHPRKNQVLLAEAAKLAGIPIVFLGKPYAEDDPYFLKFKSLVDGRIVRYPGFVSTDEKFRYLRGARGFALLSEFESGSIAVYEASAAGLPLFLSALPWANKVYHNCLGSSFTPLHDSYHVSSKLAAFYKNAHRQKGTTFPLLTWNQVAAKYVEIYRRMLAE